MHDMNVMPYGADDERNGLIDDAYEREVEARSADVTAHNLSRAERAQDEYRAGIISEPALHDTPILASVSPPLRVDNGYFTYGDTPALHRTHGITDRQAAGWDPMDGEV